MNDEEENPYAAPQSISDGRPWLPLRLYGRLVIAAGGIGLIACGITVFGIVLIGSGASSQPPATPPPVMPYLGIVAATLVGTLAFIIIAWRNLQPWVFASHD